MVNPGDLRKGGNMKHKKIWMIAVLLLVVIAAAGTIYGISRPGKEGGEAPKSETGTGTDKDKEIVSSDGMQGGSGEGSQTDWNDTEDSAKKDGTKEDDAKVNDEKENAGNVSGEKDSQSEQREEEAQPEPNNETGWGAIH